MNTLKPDLTKAESEQGYLLKVRPITGRMEIMQAFLRESIRFAGHEVKRPENWGGYAVTPNRIEFWQGRESRLHDRFLYTLQSDQSWRIERLAP
jgi:Pyridoxamine-phosphate oxidase